jgi:phospholipid/cholesterol/gamma-HCH transport system substrate-binding protein
MPTKLARLRGVGAPLTKFAIFALVTILATLVLAVTIANGIGAPTYSYYAKFTDAAQVSTGDEVRIAGVRVGTVQDVSLVDRKVALVKFALAQSVRLPKSAVATIKFQNLIGQRYISLDQDTAPPNEFLPPGGTIPLAQTRPAVSLTQLFQGFRPLLTALSPDQVNQLSFELVQVLQGEGGTVTSLLAHTASLTSTLADKDRVIGDVIDNLNQVLDTVNARDQQLTQLIITVRELVSGLAQDRHTIGEAISSLGDLTDSTADLLRDARPPLKDDIRHLGHLARNLNDRRDLVEHFITFLPKKLDRLIPLGTYGSWFNFYFCQLEVKVAPNTFLPIQILNTGAGNRCASGNDASFPFEGAGSGDHAFRPPKPQPVPPTSGPSGKPQGAMTDPASSVPGLVTSIPGLGGGF